MVCFLKKNQIVAGRRANMKIRGWKTKINGWKTNEYWFTGNYILVLTQQNLAEQRIEGMLKQGKSFNSGLEFNKINKIGISYRYYRK
jgi:hypothetical protein